MMNYSDNFNGKFFSRLHVLYLVLFKLFLNLLHLWSDKELSWYSGQFNLYLSIAPNKFLLLRSVMRWKLRKKIIIFLVTAYMWQRPVFINQNKMMETGEDTSPQMLLKICEIKGGSHQVNHLVCYISKIFSRHLEWLVVI